MLNFLWVIYGIYFRETPYQTTQAIFAGKWKTVWSCGITYKKHRKYRKSPAFAGYHIFAPAGYIERYMEDAVFRFHKTKKDDPVMAATNLFGNIINIHPFEDGNGRIWRLILAHALKQIKCCLFPVILSSFHRRGRRHYIRVVKMFDRKPSMLFTMIVKSFWYTATIILNKMQEWPCRGLKFNKDVFCDATCL